MTSAKGQTIHRLGKDDSAWQGVCARPTQGAVVVAAPCIGETSRCEHCCVYTTAHDQAHRHFLGDTGRYALYWRAVVVEELDFLGTLDLHHIIVVKFEACRL